MRLEAYSCPICTRPGIWDGPCEVCRTRTEWLRKGIQEEHYRIIKVLDAIWEEYERLQPRDLAAYQHILHLLKERINVQK